MIQMARMIGCIIFLTPEDIIERKKNMIFTLLSQLKHSAECGHKKEAMPDTGLEKKSSKKKSKKKKKNEDERENKKEE